MTIQLLPRYLLMAFFLLFSITAIATTEKLLAPQLVINKVSQALLEQLKEPDFANNKTAIRSFVNATIFPNVDTVRMAALALGKHWRKANKQQKKRFIVAFKILLVNTYSATFTEQINNWTIDYLPLKLKISDKTTSVKTIVSQPNKADIKIDYAMILRHAQWKIYDLTIAGVSLVISNRESFSQIIKDSGSLDKAIAQLEAKNQR